MLWKKQFNAKPAPDEPLFIIGDIHGRCDLLIRLVSIIDADAASRGLTSPHLVFVGDYIDRGPQSALVLSLMLKLMSDPSRRVTSLRGNHEAMLLSFLDDPNKGSRWLSHGGYETLLSFGITDVTEDSDLETLTRTAEQLTRGLGEENLTFLKNLNVSFRSGNIFVSHAGADPSKPIDEQVEADLIWGASNYNKKLRKDRIWVAHGHYADPTPTAENGRIAVDTGAYFSNQLTAARVLEGEVKFLTAEA